MKVDDVCECVDCVSRDFLGVKAFVDGTLGFQSPRLSVGAAAKCVADVSPLAANLNAPVS